MVTDAEKPSQNMELLSDLIIMLLLVFRTTLFMVFSVTGLREPLTLL
jgi:hypothetical protein